MENAVRNPRRGLLALAAVAIIAVGIWVFTTLADSERPIRAAANAYLSALEAGDAEAAFALFEPLEEALVCPDMVTNAVYDNVSFRPREAKITSVNLNDDGEFPTARVNVAYTYRAPGSTVHVTLDMTKPGEEWLVDPASDLGLSTVNLDLQGPGEIWLQDGCGATDAEAAQIRVLPGTYRLDYTDPLNVGTFDDLMLELPDPTPVVITPEATPAALMAAQTVVHAWRDECLTSGLTGPTCTEEALILGRYVNVTEHNTPRSMSVSAYPVAATDTEEAGWSYSTALDKTGVTGTTRPEGCPAGSPGGCVAGEVVEDTAFFSYSGQLSVDDQGIATLAP